MRLSVKRISEWGPTLQRLREDPPDVVAITHWVPQDLAQFMLQFAPNPIDSLIYMQYGPSIPAFREIGGESVNGVIYSTVVATLPDEIGNDFTKRYVERYGEDAVALTAGMSYDSVHYFANAAAIAGGLGAPGDIEQNRKVAAQLKRTIYRGVNGITRFGSGRFRQPYLTRTIPGIPHWVCRTSTSRSLIIPRGRD